MLHLHPNRRLPVPLLALSGKQQCQRTKGQAQKAKAGILQLCPLYALKPPRSMQNNANTTKLVDAFFRARPDAPDGALHSTDYVMLRAPYRSWRNEPKRNSGKQAVSTLKHNPPGAAVVQRTVMHSTNSVS